MHMNTIIMLLYSSIQPVKDICHIIKLMGQQYSSNFSNSCRGMVANSVCFTVVSVHPLLADNKPLNLIFVPMQFLDYINSQMKLHKKRTLTHQHKWITNDE